jgi:heme/copper-type cytochrome/quinol oxidase subunit 3
MSSHPDESGKKLGMWLFLYTEIILFGGPPGQNMFYGLYYIITGLHGIHIIFIMISFIFWDIAFR